MRINASICLGNLFQPPPGPPAGGRSPRPGIKKATPSLLSVWFAVMSVPLCCIRRNPASVPLLPGRRFFRRNPCPVAVLSRGDFFRRRFYADAHRRPAAGIASLLPSRSRRWAGTHLAGVPATRSADTPARAPGALVAEYPQHRAVGLLLGEQVARSVSPPSQRDRKSVV